MIYFTDSRSNECLAIRILFTLYFISQPCYEMSASNLKEWFFFQNQNLYFSDPAYTLFAIYHCQLLILNLLFIFCFDFFHYVTVILFVKNSRFLLLDFFVPWMFPGIFSSTFTQLKYSYHKRVPLLAMWILKISAPRFLPEHFV